MADEKITPEEQIIRTQMEGTRESLAEKLDALETQVKGTVQEATDTVEAVKDSVQETVQAVKDTVSETVQTVTGTVEDTVHTVKQTVRDTVGAVKDFLDVGAHVERHPWVMMGGALAVGFAAGKMLHGAEPAEEEQAAPASSAPMMQAAAHAAGRPNGNRHRRHAENGQAAHAGEKSVLQQLATQFEPELMKVKSLALGTVVGVLRDWLAPRLPEGLRAQFGELMEGVTEKLGAELPAANPEVRQESRVSSKSQPGASNAPSEGKGRFSRYSA